MASAVSNVAAKDTIKEKFLQRCNILASYAGNRTEPNPRVGAVMVYKNTIVAESFHPYWGGKHAEVIAIEKTPKHLRKQCALYINLEPCCFYGKTPPCTDIIIKEQIPKVVIGMIDPNPKVKGQGIAQLKKAGIEVVYYPMEEAFWLNRHFIVNQHHKRPYITLKWAQSANGVLGSHKQRLFITDDLALKQVHQLRSFHQAILVGSRTVLIDKPQLTIRKHWNEALLRIVLDPENTIPPQHPTLAIAQPIWILNSVIEEERGHCRWMIPPSWDLKVLLQWLYQKHIGSILVEGGRETLNTFLEQDLWDELHVWCASKVLQGEVLAPTFPKGWRLKERKVYPSFYYLWGVHLRIERLLKALLFYSTKN